MTNMKVSGSLLRITPEFLISLSAICTITALPESQLFGSFYCGGIWGLDCLSVPSRAPPLHNLLLGIGSIPETVKQAPKRNCQGAP